MKCLIVEDDPIMSFALTETLNETGHDICSASTLSEAYNHLKTSKFDLIILDFMLPDGTTLDVSNYAALTQPNCRIILLTGRQIFLEGENKLMAPGIDWVLRKPVSLKDLSALVDYAAHESAMNPTPAYALP